MKQALADLGKQAVLENHIVRQLEHCVCLLYQPDMTLLSMSQGDGCFDLSMLMVRGYHQQK